MHGLFTTRFKKALETESLPRPSFSRRLRRRLAMVCKHHDAEIITKHRDYSSLMAEAARELRMAYGEAYLEVQDRVSFGPRTARDLGDFMELADPARVLDALEAFAGCVFKDDLHQFQSDVNVVFAEEDSPWMMSEGRMYLVDLQFVKVLRDQADLEMRQQGFLGAQEEFTDAKDYLMAGDIDDAIHKSNRAFESALKSLLGQHEGTAGDLLKRLQAREDLLGGVPAEARNVLCSKVLEGLPILRHKLGGHGQGAEPLMIPRAYGDLAVNLAASYIKFVIDLKRGAAPPEREEVVEQEFEIPF